MTSKKELLSSTALCESMDYDFIKRQLYLRNRWDNKTFPAGTEIYMSIERSRY